MLRSIIQILWFSLWLSLPLSLRLNVFITGFLLIALIIDAFKEKPKATRYHWFIGTGFVILFILNTFSLLHDPEVHAIQKELERKSAYLVIPLIAILSHGKIKEMGKTALTAFYTGLILISIYMLGNAAIKSLHEPSLQYWTYHELCGPYHTGAIYFSWYLAIAILTVFWDGHHPLIKNLKYYFLGFFLLMLFLAVSKLFVLLVIPMLAIQYGKQLNRKQRLRSGFIALFFILGASYPILDRLSELKSTNLELVMQDEYTYDSPFNGLTLRLFQWRMGFEILNDRDAWFKGTGIGSRQEVLDSYYKKYKVYTGNPELGDRGYLGYNFHNQFVETTVGVGILGLITLLAICGLVLFYPGKELFFPLTAIIISIAFLLTESVLQRQAGVMLFTLLSTLLINASSALPKKPVT